MICNTLIVVSKFSFIKLSNIFLVLHNGETVIRKFEWDQFSTNMINDFNRIKYIVLLRDLELFREIVFSLEDTRYIYIHMNYNY